MADNGNNNDGNGNGNNNVENDNEQQQQQQQQQQQPLLLRRRPQHALNRRDVVDIGVNAVNVNVKRKTTDKHSKYKPKFCIGTKISITDNILYENYNNENNKIDIRLDGEIVGYERVHYDNNDNDDNDNDNNDSNHKYKWKYLVRFIDHNHLFEDNQQTNSDNNDDDDDDDDDDNDSEGEEGEYEDEEEVDEDEEAIAAASATAATTDNANGEKGTSTTDITEQQEEQDQLPEQDQQPEDQDQEEQCYTFLKLMSEKEITLNLSLDDPSYIIDLYFGRNLREMIQIRYTLIRDRTLLPSSTQMNWSALFQEIKNKPNTISRARFPLYDNTGRIIGDFTILSMALLILLSNKRDGMKHPDVDVDDITIIKTLLEFYPKGIEQGRYHDSNRQITGGSKYLGILHFLLENDDHEDQHVIYQTTDDDDDDDRNDQPEYFANLLDPEILKLLITPPIRSFHTFKKKKKDNSSILYDHGQYLCTEYCPSLQNHLPIHRFMYSAWVTARSASNNNNNNNNKKRSSRQKQSKHNGITQNINTIEDWLCSDELSLEIDDTILSPQVRVILKNNWQSITFMLCEKFIGTMNYSTKVLNYLLYECIGSSSIGIHSNPVEIIFGGYTHKGGGGIVKWFKDHSSHNVPNSLIALMFKYLRDNRNDIQYLFHSCLQLYVNSQQALLKIPPINIITPRRRPPIMKTKKAIETKSKSSSRGGEKEQHQLDNENGDGTTLTSKQVGVVSFSSTNPTTNSTCSINENNNPYELLECVLDALAIVQRNMVALQVTGVCRFSAVGDDDDDDGGDDRERTRMMQLRCHNIIIKHSKIIMLMWKKYYKTYWLTPSTSTNTTTKNNDFGLGINLLPRHRHPLYTAIRRNHPFRPIVQDVLNLDTSILLEDDSLSSSSRSSSSLLPPFAFAATEYCSQSLVEPVAPPPYLCDGIIDNNNDVNVIERIYELLRANPAAILLATTTTARTVEHRRRTATATATAAAKSATAAPKITTSMLAPTVTPSKPALSVVDLGQAVEEGGEGKRKRQQTSNSTRNDDGDGNGNNPHDIDGASSNNDDDDDDNSDSESGGGEAATIIITPNSKRMRRLKNK